MAIIVFCYRIKTAIIIFQCPAETESLESIDIFKDQIPEGVGLHSLRYSLPSCASTVLVFPKGEMLSTFLW